MCDVTVGIASQGRFAPQPGRASRTCWTSSKNSFPESDSARLNLDICCDREDDRHRTHHQAEKNGGRRERESTHGIGLQSGSVVTGGSSSPRAVSSRDPGMLRCRRHPPRLLSGRVSVARRRSIGGGPDSAGCQRLMPLLPLRSYSDFDKSLLPSRPSASRSAPM